MPSDLSLAGMSERPRSQPYSEYVQRQQRTLNATKTEIPGGRKLWRQMVTGFVGAACLGLVMLLLGSIFIKDAIEGQTSMTIMLCVMGMVCGLIILVGTAILGRLFISRKWRVQEGSRPPHHPPEACFHTCSIIYTPSQDQLAVLPPTDLPPSYEMVILGDNRLRTPSNEDLAGSVELNDRSGRVVQPIIMSPPQYSVAAAPLPKYGDAV